MSSVSSLRRIHYTLFSAHLANDLANEITVMLNVDCTIIVPIVVSTNGLLATTILYTLRNSLDCHSIKDRIQEAVLLQMARTVRRFLNLEP
ncbi:unnamed protein product [Euphydryas editha]|uniref:Uncharacterized protein n=1 Tax=Euphydryas editha TaxID=104508 RepID=A0AAU9TR43_EUPED|nr:unnamed protein product [Euphydryas editha]